MSDIAASCAAESVNGFTLTRSNNPDATAKARVVIQTNGRPRRFLLTQPPGYRKGSDFPPAADVLAANVIQAITRSQDGRATNYRSNGTRPPAA